LTPDDGASARARLIETRRGPWFDKSLLHAARQECLDLLRRVAREALGADTYLPGWISDAADSVHWDLIERSEERLGHSWRATPSEEQAEEEVRTLIAAATERGDFEDLTLYEQSKIIRSIEEETYAKYAAQISLEIEARKQRKIPKSNPTLTTEKDALGSALDVLHRRGVLDRITRAEVLEAPVEELDAFLLADRARKSASVCGCCGRTLEPEESVHLGEKVYTGMFALYWDRVSKPQICKPRFERTVLCQSCAPEWLMQEAEGVVTQLCAQCDRPMVYRLTFSGPSRTFCSERCGQVYHNQLRKEARARKREIACEICGKSFTASRSDAKTCSKKCKQKALRLRKKREVDQHM
jgi:hypothetical protein